MKKLITALTLAAVVAVSGCSITPTPRTYDPAHSHAYNVAQAGGLSQDIDDKRVPANQMDDLSNGALDAGYALSGFLNPQFGMSSLAGLGLNLFGMAVEPDSHGGRNSLMAWMPSELAPSEEDAQQVLFDTVQASMEKAFKSEGLTLRKTNASKNEWGVVYEIATEKWKCENGNACAVVFAITEPYTAMAPSYIHGADRTNPSYIFSAGHAYRYSRIKLISVNEAKMPEHELYKAISEHLPEWVYLYTAPGEANTADGEKINFPFILNQGQPMLFVIPE